MADGKQQPNQAKTHQQLIAGISVPNTDTVGMAIEYAKSQLEAPMFNHVVRSWLFATWVGQIRGLQA